MKESSSLDNRNHNSGLLVFLALKLSLFALKIWHLPFA